MASLSLEALRDD